MKYVLKNTVTKELVVWTMEEMLHEINRDRSDDWTPYTKNDWVDGLGLTEYELVSNCQKSADYLAAAPEILEVLDKLKCMAEMDEVVLNSDIIDLCTKVMLKDKGGK